MSDTYNFTGALRQAFNKVAKDPEEALRRFTKIIDDPNFPSEFHCQAHVGRGLVYAQCYEEYDHCIKENDAAIEYPSVQASAFINRAQGFAFYGDYENALKDYNEAVERAPDWAESYLHRGFFSCDIKEYKLAISSFTQALQCDPLNAMAYFNRGYIYMNYLKDPMKALSDFNEAIRLDPDNGDIRSYRGFLYFDMLKNEERGMEDFEAAIKLKSANGYFWRSWIQAYVRKANFEQALADMEASIKLDSFPVRYIWKAFIQLNLGLEQEAMTNLSKGNVKATRSDFYFVKGLMSLKEEKWIEALECFENVFKFHEQRYRPLPLRVLEDTEKHIATLNNMLHNAGSSS